MGSASHAPSFEYDAFICYATKPDYRLARRVQAFIEQFSQVRGGASLPRLKVCRDGSDFGATGANVDDELPDGVRHAIELLDDRKKRGVAIRLVRSRTLVVLCAGPEHHTDWMTWELSWFLAHHPQPRVLVAATRGTDPWATATDYFPPSLVHASLHDDDFGYDLRGAHPVRRDWANVRDLEDELIRMVAGLMNRPARDLSLHWERAARRRATRIAMAVGVVAVVMMVLAGVAWHLRGEANHARALAEQRARVALSRQLAAQAGVSDERPQAAVRLALDAVAATTRAGEPVTHAAESALRNALARISGRALPGHTAPVRALAIDATARFLASGSTDGRAAIWPLDDDGVAAAPRFLPHGSTVTWLDFLGPRLATATRDNRVRLWDLVGNPLSLWSVPGSAIHAVFPSPSGRWISVVDDDGGIHLWDTAAAPDAAETLPVGVHATGVAFTRDERWLIALSNFERGSDQGGPVAGDKHMMSYDLRDRAAAPRRLEGHSARIAAIAVAPAPMSSSTVAAGSADGRVSIWDVASEAPLRRHLDAGDAVEAVLFTPDGRWLVAGTRRKTAQLWRLDGAGRPVGTTYTLPGHDSAVKLLAVSADSRFLFTAGVRDAHVLVWDLEVNDPAGSGRALRGHTGDVERMIPLPDARLVTTSADRTARVWQLDAVSPSETSIPLRGHDDAIRAAVATPDGRVLVVATGNDQHSEPQGDPTIRAWTLSPPRAGTFPITEMVASSITSVVPDPTAARIVMEYRRALSLLDRTRPAMSYEVPLGPVDDNVRASLLMPDGHLLVVVEDGQILRWDTKAIDPDATRTVFARHPFPLLHVAVSPDKRWIAAGDNESGGAIWAVDGSVPPRGLVARGGITSLAYEPRDGRLLAVGADDGKVTLVDTATAGSHELSSLDESVDAVEFSADGTWLVALARYARGGRLWKLGPEGEFGAPTEIPSPNVALANETFTFDPTSRWLLLSSGHEIRARDLATGREVPLVGDRSDVRVIRFAAGGNLAVGRSSGVTELWQLGSFPTLVKVLVPSDRAAATAPAVTDIVAAGRDRIAVASEDGAIRLWSTTRTDDPIEVVLRAETGTATGITTTDDDRWLVAWNGARLELYPLGFADLEAAGADVAPPRP